MFFKDETAKINIDDLANLYDFYFSKNFFNKDFKNVINSLVGSFNEQYGFPLSINDSEVAYYPSVTSTVLLALFHMKMINVGFKNKICDSIFNLKDRTPNKITKEKIDEDYAAWDVSESANCWSTSLVIESLLETGYSGDKIEKIKGAVLWLKDQQRDDGGWGFDKTCISRIFFSSIVLFALQLGKELFTPGSSEEKDIRTTISLGLNFIEKEAVEDINTIYWTVAKGNDDADPTNTVMALWILNKLNKLSDRVKEKALRYLRLELRNKEIWDFKAIVNEINTKYGSHKIIISFTPCIPLILLDIGVDPMDELCLKPIIWLKKNLDQGWKLPAYKGGILSFAYALGLWTVIKWQRTASRNLLSKNIENNIFVQIRETIKYCIAVILISFLVIIRKYIFNSIVLLYNTFYNFYSTYGSISTMVTLMTLVMAILGIPKGISYIDQRFLKFRFKNKIDRMYKKLNAWIYVK